MGFDLEAGRQDRSVHPFTGGAHPRDVRLTTRLFEALPLSSVFSTIHEGGHGLYEQGLDEAHFRTPVAQAPSMGLHESQSRLWENLVGRSRPFWQHFLPRWKAAMGPAAAGVELDAFLRAANRVERSFIRVEADEVTYNLHIVLRTRLEVALCRGALAVRDLEEAWNQQTRDLLGFEVRARRTACCRTSTGRGASWATSPPTRWATSTPRRSCARPAATCPPSTPSWPAGTCCPCASGCARRCTARATSTTRRSWCVRSLEKG